MKRGERWAQACSVAGWGEVGDAELSPRYVIRKPDQRRGQRFCHRCLGGVRATHLGMANGVALTSGCEWHMYEWARRGYTITRRSETDQEGQ